MIPDEIDLLKRLRNHDPDALAGVFDAYADRLFRLAVSILRDDTEAEGVVQDTFVRLIESLDRLEGRAAIGTWLYRVAYNLAVDRVRRRRVVLTIDDDFADQEDTELPPPVVLSDWSSAPEEVFSTEEARSELRRTLDTLPEKLRTVFTLREIEGLSTLETAEVLGIEAGAVKVRLHRARLILREELSGYFAEWTAVTGGKR